MTIEPPSKDPELVAKDILVDAVVIMVCPPAYIEVVAARVLIATFSEIYE